MQNYMMIHMMLRVEDAHRSVKFYEDAFGFHVTRKKEKPDKKFDLIYLSDDDENFELELTYNYGHGPYDLGDGYGHLAISVPDLEASWQRHHDMGLDLRPLSGIDEGKKNFYFMQDPDGYKIEVMRAK